MTTKCEDRQGAQSLVSPGKHRELVQRDEIFLSLAREIIVKEGLHLLTMSRLAEVSGFTRGTLYQRYGSREGVLLELWLQSVAELTALMEKAFEYDGLTRERVTAATEVVKHYYEQHPENLRLMGAVGSEDVTKRITEDQSMRMAEVDERAAGLLGPLTEEAIESGELVLPPGATPDILCLTLWAMFEGITAVMRGFLPLASLDLSSPMDDALSSLQWILDGYGWRPLSSEFDYADTRKRVRNQLFAEDTPLPEAPQAPPPTASSAEGDAQPV